MSTPMSGAGRAQNRDETRQWISRRLDGWQRLAVNAPVGPAFVFGPPGSGKSFTLRAQVARLVVSGADPGKIAVLAKTARRGEAFAAALRKISGMNDCIDEMFIGTFQAYARSFVRLVRAQVPRNRGANDTPNRGPYRSIGEQHLLHRRLIRTRRRLQPAWTNHPHRPARRRLPRLQGGLLGPAKTPEKAPQQVHFQPALPLEHKRTLKTACISTIAYDRTPPPTPILAV